MLRFRHHLLGTVPDMRRLRQILRQIRLLLCRYPGNWYSILYFYPDQPAEWYLRLPVFSPQILWQYFLHRPEFSVHRDHTHRASPDERLIPERFRFLPQLPGLHTVCRPRSLLQ